VNRILAIDPGPDRSALVCMEAQPVALLYADNATVRNRLVEQSRDLTGTSALLAVEMIASYGMPVGREVFETCVWIGRFAEAWGPRWLRVYRRDVKLELCGNARAKDPHVRQSLIDLYGPGREKAIGTKAKPGPLYGVTGDLWSAVAVGVTAQRMLRGKIQPGIVAGTDCVGA
jgi:hypothetical protein